MRAKTEKIFIFSQIRSLSYFFPIFFTSLYIIFMGFPRSSVGKESACNAGDLGLIPGVGRSPGEGNSNPLQYYCLENPMDRGAWQGTAHGVARVRHDLATKPPPSTMFIGRDKDDIGKVWQGILQGVSKIWQKRIPAAAKSLQSCPTLCDPTDGSPPGFPVPGILQARILEWVAISFSNLVPSLHGKSVGKK